MRIPCFPLLLRRQKWQYVKVHIRRHQFSYLPDATLICFPEHPIASRQTCGVDLPPYSPILVPSTIVLTLSPTLPAFRMCTNLSLY